MAKFRVTRYMMGGYMADELIVEAKDEDEAYDACTRSKPEDWDVIQDIEFRDVDLIAEKIR